MDSTPLDKNKKMKKDTYGYTGVSYCNKLFKIEREIADLSLDEKVKERQKQSKPVLDEFFTWVKTVKEKNIILSDKLNTALTYALNQQKELSEFLNDGRIPLSNNRAENNIRPFTVGRKNFLFCDSIAGAKATAVMYSIVESAKMNNLDIYKYIKYLLEEIPQLENYKEESLEKYLPWSKELPAEIFDCQSTTSEVADLKIIV